MHKSLPVYINNVNFLIYRLLPPQSPTFLLPKHKFIYFTCEVDHQYASKYCSKYIVTDWNRDTIIIRYTSSKLFSDIIVILYLWEGNSTR